MALDLFFRIPTLFFTFVRNEQKKLKTTRRIKKAELIIHNMPEWQKKDLNLNVDDLNSYRHHM